MPHVSEETRPAPLPPEVGNIYRDAHEHSFLVLSNSRHAILIEYADGRTRRLDPEQWRELSAVRSLF